MKQLVYQVCYNKYQISFYLWTVGPVLKYFKVPKYYYYFYYYYYYYYYYYQDCPNMFFLLSALKLMIEISSKSLHLAGKLISIRKTTNK